MQYNLILIKEFKRARLSIVKDNEDIILLEATDHYIPIEEFREMFNYIKDQLLEKYSLTSMVFDKQKLTVFHQPSMEWYFIEWKENVYEKGLVNHRKVLPDDHVFIQSVKLGRESIIRKFPNGKYTQMNIQYSPTINEAINELINLD